MAPVSAVAAGSASDRHHPRSRFACSLESGVDSTWVNAAGEIDIASSKQLERTLDAALEAAMVTVLDLTALTFIDSAGIHVIVNAAARARRESRKLMVMRGPAQVDRVFKLTRACDSVEIVDHAPPKPATGHAGS
jgi:anti-sigma B factor antagonist